MNGPTSKPPLSDVELLGLYRRWKDGAPVADLAREAGVDRSNLSKKVRKLDAKLAAESHERRAETQRRANERRRSRRRGIEPISDPLGPDDVERTEEPNDHVPREFSTPTLRRSPVVERAVPLALGVRLPVPGYPDVPCVSLWLDGADCPRAFGTAGSADRTRFVLSVLAHEGRLLPDARYEGRYMQIRRDQESGQILSRGYVVLGVDSVADVRDLARDAFRTYEPPTSTGARVLVLDRREPGEETESDWLARKRAERRAEAERDRRRFAVVMLDGSEVVRKTGLESAEEARDRHAARLGLPLRLVELER